MNGTAVGVKSKLTPFYVNPSSRELLLLLLLLLLFIIISYCI
jgi:hypothetical protein